MELYLDIISTKQYQDIEFILINYDNVRPAGEILKTFGGRSSGYTAIKTMFDKINNMFTIKVDGNITLMNAEIVNLNSFSSHIQRDTLMSFVKQINIAEGLYLIHGELSGREDLKEDIEKVFEDNCISTKVIIPKKNQVIYF